MARNMSLIERVDIHKSCKALESIVNVFNDYCQAAESLALEQKKLSRALRDAAGLKATNELVGNALNAAATLLESLAEVDSRFVKVADKECETASNDLKKWFKKLAKEEKNHDDRIATANARIKQAGQTYEKKAKRKDRDAVEEHTRYVNLLSAIGPEMSQEKYNHALFVTQRHTSTVYSVASSITRTADAEWTRACDCVRRFSPVIGRLGECRAYLEGEWLGSLPGHGPDNIIEENIGGTINNDDEREPTNGNRVNEMGVRITAVAPASASNGHIVHHPSAAAYTSTTGTDSPMAPSSASSSQIPHSQAQAPSLNRSHSNLPPPSSYSPATGEKLNTDSVRSIESLSSFPSPPVHFPLPDLARLPPVQANIAEYIARNEGEGKSDAVKQSSNNFAASVPGVSDTPTSLSESPKPMNVPFELSTPALTEDGGRSPQTAQNEPLTPAVSPATDANPLKESNAVKAKRSARAESPDQPRLANEAATQNRRTSGSIERSGSVVSTNSIVASMRDKWSRGDALASSPPRERDMPRVPNKVTDLASRYKPTLDPSITVPLSPRYTGQRSPTTDRIRQVSGPQSSRDDAPSSPTTGAIQGMTPAPTSSEFDLTRRRQRIEELEDLERREQAQALRAREREVEQRVRELERERLRLRTLGATPSSGSAATPIAAVRSHPQYSHSMTNLVAPRSNSSGDLLVRPVSQHGEPLALALSASQSSSSSTSIPQPRSDHAPFCGCYTCSAAQYGAQPNSTQAPPQTRPEREKPRGWMRRLSMPVVSNAFSASSSDSKKTYGSGTGVSASGRTSYAAEGPFPRFEQDGTGGISNVNNARPRKLSFGRR
ncbi:hypothetical protein M0805_005213 [Coniferiporia weirii]|nr:hypothetical protein M0805_005213 [Coniferiporia weirii]